MRKLWKATLIKFMEILKMIKEKEMQKFKCNIHVTYSEAVRKRRENTESQQKM